MLFIARQTCLWQWLAIVTYIQLGRAGHFVGHVAIATNVQLFGRADFVSCATVLRAGMVVSVSDSPSSSSGEHLRVEQVRERARA